MSTSIDSLPWSSLKLEGSAIPWDHLREIAAAAEAREVRERLMNLATRNMNRRYAGDGTADRDLTDLAALAIFALAAERMDGKGRREAAEFLLHTAYRAGEADDEITLQVAVQAVGRLGAVVVEPALHLVERIDPEQQFWSYLVELLRLAETADGAMREAAIHWCRHVIRESPDRFSRYSIILAPVWVLAELHDTDSLPLLRSIHARSRSPDLEEAIELLEGRSDLDEALLAPSWEVPVELWFPERIDELREWFEDQDNEDELPEEESTYDRRDGVLHIAEGSDVRQSLPGVTHLHGGVFDDSTRRKIGRNEPCSCGSGRKYKKCCGR